MNLTLGISRASSPIFGGMRAPALRGGSMLVLRLFLGSSGV